MVEYQLYTASKNDIPWIDSIYTKIQFLPSDYSKEYIVIAKANNEKVGLGRLIQIDNVLELGGMYVADNYRNKGIAGAIVKHLLAQAPKGKLVYCIPFAHLAGFYKSFGFVDAKISDDIPQEIKHKIGYCSQTYSTETLLLQMVK